MVNNGSGPPSCRKVPQQCWQSDRVHPQVNAYSPEAGLGGSMWLVALDSFHMSVEELCYGGVSMGGVDKGSCLLAGKLPCCTADKSLLTPL